MVAAGGAARVAVGPAATAATGAQRGHHGGVRRAQLFHSQQVDDGVDEERAVEEEDERRVDVRHDAAGHGERHGFAHEPEDGEGQAPEDVDEEQHRDGDEGVVLGAHAQRGDGARGAAAALAPVVGAQPADLSVDAAV